MPASFPRGERNANTAMSIFIINLAAFNIPNNVVASTYPQK